jgi:hypothetical protein
VVHAADAEAGHDPPGHTRLRELADEQAALRRVATLLAGGARPAEVFAAVAAEAGRLLSVEYAALSRYGPDRGVTVVAVWGRTGHNVPLGNRMNLGGNNVGTLVFETGRPARIDSYADASGPLGDLARGEGVGAAVGTPVIVEGRLWGVMATYSAPGQPLPADTEARRRQLHRAVGDGDRERGEPSRARPPGRGAGGAAQSRDPGGERTVAGGALHGGHCGSWPAARRGSRRDGSIREQ